MVYNDNSGNIFLACGNVIIVVDVMFVVIVIDFVIERLPEHGGDISYPNYQALEDAFAQQVRINIFIYQ